jgi:hypothetical protein
MLLFRTKMYLLIKDTLFHSRRCAGFRQTIFPAIQAIYPVDLGEKPALGKTRNTEIGMKAAFVKCTFY